MDLPEWSKDLENHESAVARFVYHNEPADRLEAEQFRALLKAALEEAEQQGRASR